MPSLRRSLALLLGALVLLPTTLALTAVPAPVVHADAGDAVAGTPRASAGRLAAGERHTCALVSPAAATSGSVRCWGDNTVGQLGYGDTRNRGDETNEMGGDLPAVDLGRPAVSISAGVGHTCAILDNGGVKCWGFNNTGQLGLGDLDPRGDAPGEMGANLPTVALGTGRTASFVTAGVQHTCALLDNGRVKCWGDNSLGQLGQGDTTLRGDGPGEMGDALPYVDLGPNRTAITISAGGAHTCAILDTHAVKCWGSNEDGQLGYGDTNHRGDQPGEMGAALPTVDLGAGFTARAITTGRFHTCALLTDTDLRCWGLNADGQLGQGSTLTRGDGPGEMGDNLQMLEYGDQAERITSLTATAFGTCMTWTQIGGLLLVSCWGDNDHGQLGLGSVNDQGTSGGTSWRPISMDIGPVVGVVGGGDHVCMVTLDHDVRCVGANDSGQLGVGAVDDRGDVSGETSAVADVVLADWAGVSTVSAGASHSCAVLTDGSVRCWGDNADGQLGLGDTAARGDQLGEMGAALPPVDLGTGRTAVDVSAGLTATCAVLDNGQVKCWGVNTAGKLGLGDTATRGDQPGEMGDALPAVPLRTGRTAIAVETGGTNTCAVLDDHSLVCWGANTFGQLAQGDITTRGDQPGELGDALAPIGFGPGRTVADVAVGVNVVCALLDDGSVSCWGGGPSGELGVGDSASWGTDPAELGANMLRIALGTGRTALQIDLHDNTPCAVRDDHRVVCWGENSAGEIGNGTLNSIGDNPGEMGDALTPVPMPTGESAAAVSAGFAHTCVRFASGRAQCWGRNDFGQLGIDQDGDRGDQAGELGDVLPYVTFPAGDATLEISAGNFHACARLASGRLQCWGAGSFGRLGNGSTADVGTLSSPLAGAPGTDLGTTTVELLPFVVTPGIPTGMSASAGAQSATLTWTAPHTDGGAAVSGYRIEQSIDGGDVWSVLVANTGTAATARTLTALAAGQSIRFRVAAINAAGASASSLPSAPVTPTAPVPPPPAPPAYAPLTPGRLADTRPDGTTVDGIGAATGLLAAGQTLTVQVTGRANVPAGAAAAVLNVTAVTPGGPGFLTVFPCDAAERPNASSVNYQAGQIVPNAVISKLSAAGTVCIYTLAAAHVLVDVTGAYPAGAAYLPVTPARVADTRPDGTTVDGQGQATGLLRNQFVAVLTVKVTGRANVPTGATAAVLNVTAVTPDRAGFLTVFPCDRDQPNASSVNYQAGQIVANAVVTKLAADGTVCIASSADSTHVLVDVVGAFPAGADYTPLVPARFTDTRPGGLTVDGDGAGTGVLGAGQTLTVQVAGRDQVPGGAIAAVLNVTAVAPDGPGFLTVYPCDAAERPNASSVNYQAGQIVPNAVITKLAANGTVCIYTLAATHVLVDVTGAS